MPTPEKDKIGVTPVDNTQKTVMNDKVEAVDYTAMRLDGLYNQDIHKVLTTQNATPVLISPESFFEKNKAKYQEEKDKSGNGTQLSLEDIMPVYNELKDGYENFHKLEYQKKVWSEAPGWKTMSENTASEYVRKKLGFSPDEYYYKGVMPKVEADNRWITDSFLRNKRVMTDEQSAEMNPQYWDHKTGKWKTGTKEMIANYEKAGSMDFLASALIDPIHVLDSKKGLGPRKDLNKLRGLSEDDAGVNVGVALDYKEDGTPFYRTFDKSQSEKKSNARSIWGAQEMNNAWYTEAASSFANSLVLNIPSVVGSLWSNVSTQVGSQMEGLIDKFGDRTDMQAFTEKKKRSVDSIKKIKSWGDFLQNQSSIAYIKEGHDIVEKQKSGLGIFSDGELFGKGIGSAIGSLAQAFLVGGVVRGVGLGAEFGGVISKGFLSLAAADGFNQEAKEMGIDENDASKLYFAAAGLTYLSESVFGDDLIFKGTADWVKKGAMKEGTKGLLKDAVLKQLQTEGVASVKELSKNGMKNIAKQYSKSLVSTIRKHASSASNKYANSFFDEGISEALEGIGHNGLKIFNDWSLATESTDRDIDGPATYGNGKFFEEGSSTLKNIFGGVLDDFVLGGLASIPVSMFNKVDEKHKVFQKDVIRNSILRGEDALLLKSWDEMKSDKAFANPIYSEDGTLHTVDDGKRNINDAIYDQLVSQMQLEKQTIAQSGLLKIKDDLMNGVLFKDAPNAEEAVNQILKGRIDIFDEGNKLVKSGLKILDSIALLEKDLKSGKLSQEGYDTSVAKLNSDLTKIKDGTYLRQTLKEALVEKRYASPESLDTETTVVKNKKGQIQKATTKLKGDVSNQNIKDNLGTFANADKLSDIDPIKTLMTGLKNTNPVLFQKLFSNRVVAQNVDNQNKTTNNEFTNRQKAIQDFTNNTLSFDSSILPNIQSLTSKLKNPDTLSLSLDDINKGMDDAESMKVGVQESVYNDLKAKLGDANESAFNAAKQALAKEMGASDEEFEATLDNSPDPEFEFENFVSQSQDPKVKEYTGAQQKVKTLQERISKSKTREQFKSQLPDLGSTKEQSYLSKNYGNEEVPNLVDYQQILSGIESTLSPDDVSLLQEITDEISKKIDILKINEELYSKLSRDISFLTPISDITEKDTDLANKESLINKLINLHQKADELTGLAMARSQFERKDSEIRLRLDQADLNRVVGLVLKDNFFASKEFESLSETERKSIQQKINDSFNSYSEATINLFNDWILHKQNTEKKLAAKTPLDEGADYDVNANFQKIFEKSKDVSKFEYDFIGAFHDVLNKGENNETVRKAFQSTYNSIASSQDFSIKDNFAPHEFHSTTIDPNEKKEVVDANGNKTIVIGGENTFFNHKVFDNDKANGENSLIHAHLTNLSNLIFSGVNPANIAIALDDVKSELGFIPSYEQELAIRQIISFISRTESVYENSPQSTEGFGSPYLKNILSFLGAAGTGKTSSMQATMLIYKKLFGVKGKILMSASTQANIDTLEKKASDAKIEDEHIDSIKLSELYKNVDSLKADEIEFMIVDEASHIGNHPDQFKDEQEYLDFKNKLNSKGIKIVAIMDSSQMTNRWNIQYPIADLLHNTEKTIPLQIIQRSNVYYINKLQQILRQFTYDLTTRSRTSNPSYQPTKYNDKTGVRLRKQNERNEQIKDFAEDLKAGVISKDQIVYIVVDEDDRKAVIDSLKTYGIDESLANNVVKTLVPGLHPSQGLEWDVVYGSPKLDKLIFTPTPDANLYKGLLTIATRARNKVDLVVPSFNAITQDSLVSEKVSEDLYDNEDVKKAKEDFFNEYNGVRTAELVEKAEYLKSKGFNVEEVVDETQPEEKTEGEDPTEPNENNPPPPPSGGPKPVDSNIIKPPAKSNTGKTSKVDITIDPSGENETDVKNYSAKRFNAGLITLNTNTSPFVPYNDVTTVGSHRKNGDAIKLHNEIKLYAYNNNLPLQIVYHKEKKLSTGKSPDNRRTTNKGYDEAVGIFKHVVLAELNDISWGKIKKQFNLEEVDRSSFGIISSIYDIDNDNIRDLITENTSAKSLVSSIASQFQGEEFAYERFKGLIRLSGLKKAIAFGQNSVVLGAAGSFSLKAGRVSYLSSYELKTKGVEGIPLTEFMQDEDAHSGVYNVNLTNPADLIWLGSNVHDGTPYEGYVKYPGYYVKVDMNVNNANVLLGNNASNKSFYMSVHNPSDTQNDVKNNIKLLKKRFTDDGIIITNKAFDQIDQFLNSNSGFFTNDVSREKIRDEFTIGKTPLILLEKKSYKRKDGSDAKGLIFNKKELIELSKNAKGDIDVKKFLGFIEKFRDIINSLNGVENKTSSVKSPIIKVYSSWLLNTNGDSRNTVDYFNNNKDKLFVRATRINKPQMTISSGVIGNLATDDWLKDFPDEMTSAEKKEAENQGKSNPNNTNTNGNSEPNSTPDANSFFSITPQYESVTESNFFIPAEFSYSVNDTSNKKKIVDTVDVMNVAGGPTFFSDLKKKMGTMIIYNSAYSNDVLRSKSTGISAAILNSYISMKQGAYNAMYDDKKGNYSAYNLYSGFIEFKNSLPKASPFNPSEIFLLDIASEFDMIALNNFEGNNNSEKLNNLINYYDSVVDENNEPRKKKYTFTDEDGVEVSKTAEELTFKDSQTNDNSGSDVKLTSVYHLIQFSKPENFSVLAANILPDYSSKQIINNYEKRIAKLKSDLNKRYQETDVEDESSDANDNSDNDDGYEENDLERIVTGEDSIQERGKKKGIANSAAKTVLFLMEGIPYNEYSGITKTDAKLTGKSSVNKIASPVVTANGMPRTVIADNVHNILIKLANFTNATTGGYVNERILERFSHNLLQNGVTMVVDEQAEGVLSNTMLSVYDYLFGMSATPITEKFLNETSEFKNADGLFTRLSMTFLADKNDTNISSLINYYRNNGLSNAVSKATGGLSLDQYETFLRNKSQAASDVLSSVVNNYLSAQTIAPIKTKVNLGFLSQFNERANDIDGLKNQNNKKMLSTLFSNNGNSYELKKNKAAQLFDVYLVSVGGKNGKQVEMTMAEFEEARKVNSQVKGAPKVEIIKVNGQDNIVNKNKDGYRWRGDGVYLKDRNGNETLILKKKDNTFEFNKDLIDFFDGANKDKRAASSELVKEMFKFFGIPINQTLINVYAQFNDEQKSKAFTNEIMANTGHKIKNDYGISVDAISKTLGTYFAVIYGQGSGNYTDVYEGVENASSVESNDNPTTLHFLNRDIAILQHYLAGTTEMKYVWDGRSRIPLDKLKNSIKLRNSESLPANTLIAQEFEALTSEQRAASWLTDENGNTLNPFVTQKKGAVIQTIGLFLSEKDNLDRSRSYENMTPHDLYKTMIESFYISNILKNTRGDVNKFTMFLTVPGDGTSPQTVSIESLAEQNMNTLNVSDKDGILKVQVNHENVKQNILKIGKIKENQFNLSLSRLTNSINNLFQFLTEKMNSGELSANDFNVSEFEFNQANLIRLTNKNTSDWYSTDTYHQANSYFNATVKGLFSGISDPVLANEAKNLFFSGIDLNSDYVYQSKSDEYLLGNNFDVMDRNDLFNTKKMDSLRSSDSKDAKKDIDALFKYPMKEFIRSLSENGVDFNKTLKEIANGNSLKFKQIEYPDMSSKTAIYKRKTVKPLDITDKVQVEETLTKMEEDGILEIKCD